MMSRSRPVASEIEFPDSSVTGPIGNNTAPLSSPTPATSRQAAKQKSSTITYLVTSSLVRPAGTVSSVRSVPSPASPAIESPATTATASGSITVSSRNRENSERNTPLSAIWPMNAPPPGPPPEPGGGVLIRSTMPRKTGAPASTANMARLRGRRKTIRHSDRKSRSQCLTGAAGVASPAGPAGPAGPADVLTAALLVDIEALTGQPDEQILQAGPDGLQAGHRDSRAHQLGVDPLRRLLAEPGADLAVLDGDLGQPQAGQPLGGRASLDGPNQDPRLAAAAQVGQRALEHEFAGAHHPDVRADLLHLGQQMRGDEDGGAVGRDLLDQGPDLPGALRVEPVGRLIENHQVARSQQPGGDAEPLLHAQRVGPVSLVGGS